MTMLALLCTAVVGMAGGARLVSVLLAMFLVWAAFRSVILLGFAHKAVGYRCEPSLFRVGDRHRSAWRSTSPSCRSCCGGAPMMLEA